jgi:Fic family protein
MPLFVPPTLDAADHEVLDLIADQHRRLRPLVAAPRRWQGLLRRVALARAIRGSNTIEGFTVSVDDAFAALDDAEPLDAGTLAWRAVRGYRDAMTYALELAKERDPKLSVDTIKALHFLMQQYDLSKWPGRLRPDQVFVFDEDNEETVYVGPEAEQVPALMRELVDDINRHDPELPVLVRAALAHLNLVMIHPFKDGNGRMARCLQTLLLTGGGVLPAPEFVSIEEYLGRNEHDYYRVLAEVGGGAWHPERDTSAWIRFCLTAHHRQALLVERRNRLAGEMWIRAEQVIEDAGLPSRCVEPLAFALDGRVLRNSTYRQLVPDVSNNLASRDLNELVKAGLLAAIGENRGRRYLPSTALQNRVAGMRHKLNRELPVDGDPYQRIVANR